MPHKLEAASSGRAKCRGCGQKIEKGELRFGEAVPNPFGDGEATHWYHLRCGAEKRPEAFSEVLSSVEGELEGREELERLVELGIAHPRLRRFVRAERAPSGRARCQGCRELIEKDALRIVLERVEDGMVSGAGFVHVECAKKYAGTTAGVFARIARNDGKLSDEELSEVKQRLEKAEAEPLPDDHDSGFD